MKKAYSEFICWKEKLYGDLFRALNTNDKSALLLREQPASKEAKQPK